MTNGAAIHFRKMNGLGNEIVMVDLRGTSRVFSEQDARTIAADPRSHFDQLMVLHDPRSAGTDAYVRIYNTDGSAAGACGNGTRCIAWIEAEQTGRNHLKFETAGGILDAQVVNVDDITVDMGRPRFRWDEIPLAEQFHDTRKIELQIGPADNPIVHSPSVVNVEIRTRSSGSMTWIASTWAGSGHCLKITRSSRSAPTSHWRRSPRLQA